METIPAGTHDCICSLSLLVFLLEHQSFYIPMSVFSLIFDIQLVVADPSPTEKKKKCPPPLLIKKTNKSPIRIESITANSSLVATQTCCHFEFLHLSSSIYCISRSSNGMCDQGSPPTGSGSEILGSGLKAKATWIRI